MNNLSKAAAAVMISLMILPPSVHADGTSVVRPADLDRALKSKMATEREARDSIKKLLARDDVRALATDMGLDIRRANSAVDTLTGRELDELNAQAAAAEAVLGGAQTVQISLVALLLIVIIVILLVK